MHRLIKRQSCHHIETSQLICSANQLVGFYMMATLAFNALITHLTIPPLLAYPRFELLFILYTDTLLSGLDFALSDSK